MTAFLFLILSGVLPGLGMSLFMCHSYGNEYAFSGFIFGALFGMIGGLMTLWTMQDSLTGWGVE